MTPRIALIALAAASAAAMLYVGLYQLRMVEHLSCPLFNRELNKGCEAVADAPFARPFGIPDGLIAVALYVLVILLALAANPYSWAPWPMRILTILAAAANALGVIDMARFGAWCFYCLLTAVLSPFLVWAAFAA